MALDGAKTRMESFDPKQALNVSRRKPVTNEGTYELHHHCDTKETDDFYKQGL
jgi:hypothetical protein